MSSSRNAKSTCSVLLINTFFISKGYVSPWLEASDPFLRSSVTLLADAGLLSAPVNQYPARWSFFGEDLVANSSSVLASYPIALANQEVEYFLQSAKLNRGHRLFKFVGANQQSSLSGFGQPQKDQKGVYTSYEHLDKDYAFRLSGGYREYNDDRQISWANSYLSLNDGAWLYSIGNLDRWWGPSWQYNLILGSYAQAEPGVSVSYTGETDVLGLWSAETILAVPDNDLYDYHSATRLTSKPSKLFEYGMTYQMWLSDGDDNEDDKQLALDAALTLPHVKDLYHRLYGEVASTAKVTELGAWLVGWTGSFPIGENTIRIVLESQQSTHFHGKSAWHSATYPSITQDVSNTTYPLENSASIALYIQLHNDHNMVFSYQKSELNDEKTNTTQLTYRLPALSGMLHFSLDYRQIETDLNHNNQLAAWAGYEFRF